jgi:hypothetical protein
MGEDDKENIPKSISGDGVDFKFKHGHDVNIVSM